ncbi:hypothetical protein N7499_001546 [Penicillium canescens]|uniref:Uncharacterized protein n=1 Tax=Penicillium canescens TaxID=5083 RepID=A0AAD6I5K5_PENCN|nr:uncharacterized protein N7446_009086 [Penicillium canescens]KAJ6034337.1 hypothetical protein N7460_008512 [Penicillium canescens]KAJ6045999.1 hypothetical protein N7444_007253 [Penicillium canescens]KAJ6053074.1 hypothetical protein N7446_009086 [Penicillium canescens]KAJ6097172.1 hypothetical protein N7499_001546 [Penicillium canescens]KAJ6165162.1 hypothetical protein N7485_008406 [Penicillium canescens]
MTNYGVLIYASLGLGGSIPLLLNACWTSFTLIGNTWTAFYVVRVGRRTCMLIGSIGCTVSVICVTLGLSSFYLAPEVTLVAAPVALNSIVWTFYLVLIVPSLCYIVAIYFLPPETEGRTLEEVGALFGDEANVVSQWYNVTQEEQESIAQKAFHEKAGGSSSDSAQESDRKPAVVHDVGS